ncbi:MAG: acetate uptake transporter [Candidatus Odinarchaeia archaeon]
MSETQKQILADPSALGLFGFGLTTVLLNIHNLGLVGLANTMAIAYGFFYGGIAQVIAGIIDFKRNNLFGGTAFTSYGLFWLGLALAITFNWMGLIVVTPIDLAWTMLLWGVFTTVLFAGSFKTNKALSFVLGSLALLFYLLTLSNFILAVDPTMTIPLTITGIEGIICGGSAMYTAAAIVLNSMYGREVLPLGPYNK